MVENSDSYCVSALTSRVPATIFVSQFDKKRSFKRTMSRSRNHD